MAQTVSSDFQVPYRRPRDANTIGQSKIYVVADPYSFGLIIDINSQVNRIREAQKVRIHASYGLTKRWQQLGTLRELARGHLGRSQQNDRDCGIPISSPPPVFVRLRMHLFANTSESEGLLASLLTSSPMYTPLRWPMSYQINYSYNSRLCVNP